MLTASKVAIGLAAPVGLYAIILGTLMTPYLQRFALYAHKFNTLFIHDVNNVERFGFTLGQVSPFNIHTPDGETLYAWHVLPMDVYARDEEAFRNEPQHTGPVNDLTGSRAFKFLSESPDARVVISFHGNAGHIAQGWRPDTYRSLVSQPNTHVLTIDYRGFGHSTGSPTEAGLITDGVALVNWVLDVANIPPERIVILGQSLGTAVASAVALRLADPTNSLLPPIARQTIIEKPKLPIDDSIVSSSEILDRSAITFAGVILVAPFASLPSLMLTYRMGGIVPLLAPLRPFPFITNPVLSRMVDQWPTADRLTAYHRILSNTPKLLIGEGGRRMAGLQIYHARSDRDISWRQTEMIAKQVLGNEESALDGGQGTLLIEAGGRMKPRVRVELVKYGGHNRIMTYAPVGLAVLRAFEDL